MKTQTLLQAFLFLIMCACFQSCDDGIQKYTYHNKYVVTAKKNLNIRADDYSGSNVIGQFQSGDTIITRYSARSSGWLPVDFINDAGESCFGYVSKNLVRHIEEVRIPTPEYAAQLAQEAAIKAQKDKKKAQMEVISAPVKEIADMIPIELVLFLTAIFIIIGFFLVSNDHFIASACMTILASACAYIYFGANDFNASSFCDPDIGGWILAIIAFIAFGACCYLQTFSFVCSLIRIARDSWMSMWPVYGYLICIGLFAGGEVLHAVLSNFDVIIPQEIGYLFLIATGIFACIATFFFIKEEGFFTGLLMLLLMTIGAAGTAVMSIIFVTMLIFITLIFLIACLVLMVFATGSGGSSRKSSSNRGSLQDSYGHTADTGEFHGDKFYSDYGGRSYTRRNGNYELDE